MKLLKIQPGDGRGENICSGHGWTVTAKGSDVIEDAIEVGVDVGDRRLVELVQLAGAEGFQLSEISVSKPSLGDVFLAVYGA